VRGRRLLNDVQQPSSPAAADVGAIVAMVAAVFFLQLLCQPHLAPAILCDRTADTILRGVTVGLSACLS